MEDKLDEIHHQIKSLALLEGDFETLVIDQLKTQKSNIEMKLTAKRNKLLTSHNIESKIKHYKLLLKEYKKPIDDLSEFPFQDLFDKALVNERNDIEFVLNPFNTISLKSIYSFPEIITPYKIRKTLFESTSKISCF